MKLNEQSTSTTHTSPFNVGRFLFWLIIPFVLNVTVFAVIGMAGMSGFETGSIWSKLVGSDNSFALTITLISLLSFFLLYTFGNKA